jgi:hypothetical protein
VKTHSILVGTVAVLLAGAAIGCGSANTNSNADRSADRTAAQPAPPPPDWTTDRDAYITRRNQDLDELQNRWDNLKVRADRKARNVWGESEDARTTLRHDLDEAKNETREKWDTTKQKLDENWNRIEEKTRDAFRGERHGS